MRKVGLKVLKNKLSEYVRAAASGETVLVTDRKKVVAELVPPRQAEGPLSYEEFRAKAIREGNLKPATDRSGKPPPRLAVATFDEIMRELDQDREDR
jgi:prevent-host-death family protein